MFIRLRLIFLFHFPVVIKFILLLMKYFNHKYCMCKCNLKNIKIQFRHNIYTVKLKQTKNNFFIVIILGTN